jgi:hypothetical protein
VERLAGIAPAEILLDPVSAGENFAQPCKKCARNIHEKCLVSPKGMTLVTVGG